MKTILLMRHAKSSWKEPLSDHERPLNKRGRKAAKKMGKFLEEHALLPELILSSDAVRARETAHRLAKAAGFPEKKISLTPELYDAGADEILDLIRSLDPKIDSVLLIAHNPGISDAAVHLCGDPMPTWMPTAAITVIDFDTESWKTIGEKKGRLRLYLTPKGLEAEE
ncbi:SixA phosphatase family protein [Nitratifractor sp.]